MCVAQPPSLVSICVLHSGPRLCACVLHVCEHVCVCCIAALACVRVSCMCVSMCVLHSGPRLCLLHSGHRLCADICELHSGHRLCVFVSCTSNLSHFKLKIRFVSSPSSIRVEMSSRVAIVVKTYCFGAQTWSIYLRNGIWYYTNAKNEEVQYGDISTFRWYMCGDRVWQSLEATCDVDLLDDFETMAFKSCRTGRTL